MRPGLRDSYTYSALLTLIGKTEGPAEAVKVLSEARAAGVRPNRYPPLKTVKARIWP